MPDNDPTALRYALLDEPLIRWRDCAKGELRQSSLPELFAAMAANEVRDFPALRPHQRHPWHAFLTQLGAIALHHAEAKEPWLDSTTWRNALLALTPNDPDGAAWCLVSPPDRPALLQAPVPDTRVDGWKTVIHAADELDMLVTSKNHDLKGARSRKAFPDDWLFALVSLQTQEGYLGAGNYGISRMNSGYGTRPGVGVAPVGTWSARWRSDLTSLLEQRDRTADTNGLAQVGGNALLWLLPWSGVDSLAMSSLDPFYIEICRRARLVSENGLLSACTTGSKAARVAGKDRNGVTGDSWTPIDVAKGKAMSMSGRGFDYRLMSDLLTSGKYMHGAAYRLIEKQSNAPLQMVAQATVRGEGKTEGFHERRVPISPRLRRLLVGPQRLSVEQIAKQRIESITALRNLLWSALIALFANGKSGDHGDNSNKDKADRFVKPFEQAEDARFFDDLNVEIDAEDAERSAQRVAWLIELVGRAEAVLVEAFEAGPRNGAQRYKARAAALSRFHGGLRGAKPTLPDLAHHYRQQAEAAHHAQEDPIDV